MILKYLFKTKRLKHVLLILIPSLTTKYKFAKLFGVALVGQEITVELSETFQINEAIFVDKLFEF